MADGFSLNLDKINANAAVNVAVTVKGQEKIDAIARSLNNLATGTKLNEYLKDQEHAFDRIIAAVERYNTAQSKANAGELIKSVNAFKATLGEIDPSSVVTGWEKVEAAFKSAMTSFGQEFRGFDVSNFKDTLALMEELKKNGADIDTVFSRLGQPANVAELNKQIEQLQYNIGGLSARLNNVIEERDALLNGQEISRLQEIESKFQSITDTMAGEFGAFLRANDLESDDAPWARFYEYFENIRNGSMTAKEAITQVREELIGMIQDAQPGDTVFSTAQMEEFIDKLNIACESIEHMRSEVEELNNRAITRGVAEQMSESTELTEKQRDAMRELIQESSGLNNVSQILGTMIETFDTTDEHVRTSTDAFKELLQILDSIAHVEPANMEGFDSVLKNLRMITEFNIDNKKMASLEEALRSLASIPDLSKIAMLGTVDLTGFSNLKVSTTISHLTDNLPKLSQEVNVEKLSALGQISLANFDQNNLKISKASMEHLRELISTINGTQFDPTKVGAGDAVAVDTAQLLAAKIQSEMDALRSENKELSDHIKAIEEAGAAEQNKAKIAELLEEALKREAEAAQRAEEAAKADAEAEAKASEEKEKAAEISERAADAEEREVEASEKAADADKKEADAAAEVADAKKKETEAISEGADAKEKDAEASEKGADASERSAEASAKDAEAKERVSDASDHAAESAQKLKDTTEGIADVTERAQDATSKYAEGTEKQSRALTRQEQELAKVQTALKNVESEKNRIASSKSAGGINSEIYGDLSALEGKLRALADLGRSMSFQEIRDEMASIKREFAELDRQANVFKIADNVSSQATKAAEEFRKLGESIGNLSMKYIEKLDLEKLRELDELLIKMNDETLSSDAKTDAYRRFMEIVTPLSAQVRELAQAQKDEAAAAKEAEAAQRSLDKERNQQQATIKQLNNLLVKCTDAEREFAAAQHTASGKEDYAKLQATTREVRELIAAWESGSMPMAEIAKRARELDVEFSRINTTLKTSGNFFTNYMTNGMNMLKSRLSYMFGLAAIVMKSVNEIKKMITTAVELDEAMNQLQVVTRGSTDDMAAYSKQVSQMAKDTAQSTKDLIDATTVYARLGYSMDESAILAKYTAMMQGVGNIDASTAQDAMTAIIKAFGMGVDKIETIMDKMVTVGNNFPISVSEIAQGMNNAGSALSAAGNSLDESIALLTAANTTVQNISKSSTGLRTIAARLRKTTVELDDLGETIEEAKYQKVLDMLTGRGVKITEGGEYRSTYAILRDIASIWDQLSTMERAGIAEQLSGTRQQNVFYSIIEQFREAEKAMDAMSDSGGALQEAFDIRLSSIQSHVNQLKAAFDELSVSFLDSDFAKGAVDALRTILELLTKVIDKIGVGGLIGGIIGLTVAFKALTGTMNAGLVLSVSKFFIGLPAMISAATAAVSLFITRMMAIPAILKASAAGAVFATGSFGAGVTKIAMALTGFAGTITSVIGLTVALAAGIEAVAKAAYKKIHPPYDELKKSADEAKAKVEELQNKIEENQKQIDDLEGYGKNLTQSEKDRLQVLKEQNERYKEQLELAEKIAEARERRANNELLYNTKNEFSKFMTPATVSPLLLDLPDTEGHNVEPIGSDEGLNAVRNYIKEIEEANKEIDALTEQMKNVEDGSRQFKKLEAQVEAANKRIEEAKLPLMEYAETLYQWREIFAENNELELVQQVDDILADITKATGKSTKSFEDFKEQLKSLDKDILRKLLEDVKMSDDEIEKFSEWLIKSGYSAKDAATYIARYVEELNKVPEAESKIDAKTPLGDLVSLRDELTQTTEAIEKYKEALSGGEKGDAVKEMADIYKGALEDISAGKIDSKRMHAAADLFFSPEQLKAWGHDLTKVAQALSSDMMKYLFDPEGESDLDYGQRFAKFVQQNFSKAQGVWMDGKNFYYNSLSDLARAFGMSEAACSAFLDSLDAYGINVMRSTEENNELISQFNQIRKESNSAREAVEKFAQAMRDQGKDKYDTISVLNDLQNAGVIKIDDSQLNDIVSKVYSISNEVENEDPTLKFHGDASNFESVVSTIESRINALTSRSYTIRFNAVAGVATTAQSVTSGVSNLLSSIFNKKSGAIGGRGKGGETLVNELGPELISENGEAYIANGGKPGFVNLSKDAIVFTADETEEIFDERKKNGKKVPAFAEGSRASLRERLLGGRRTPAHSLGSAISNFVDKTAQMVVQNVPLRTMQCARCGNTITYSSADNPSGYTGACPFCGQTYRNGRTQTYYVEPTPAPQEVYIPPDPEPEVYYETYGGGGYDYGGYDSYEEPRYSKVDWIEKLLDRIRRAAEDVDKVVNSTFKNLSTRVNAAKEEASILTEEIRNQWDAFNRYSAEAEGIGLSEDLAEKVRNGSINIVEYDEDTVKLINEYAQWYEKALDCKQAIDDLHESIAQLYTDTFTNVQTDFENRLSETEHSIEMINKNISMAQAHGYLDNVTYYSDLIANTTNEVATLELELSELNRYFNEAMATEEIDEYSEAWYEMKQAIADTEEALADANIQLVEYKNTMREIQWNAFDYAMGRVSQIGEEAQFLINLMSNDNLFQDNGQFNDLGEATAGMHVVNYDSYMAQADEYAKEIQKIEREMAGDPYNSKLIERREELLSLQRQNILSAESEKNAIKDLVSQGIQMELTSLQDLIDAYVDALDSAKDLYDYQRKVAEQTGDIAALEKQLTAYQNDTSEENRARVQKLQQQLREARQNLSDTEYDRSISDQKKLLDELYTEYEDAMNGRLDNVDALMAEMINGANENRDAINTTIHEVADEVGYTITEGFNYVMGEQFSNYSGMFENLNGIHATIINIYDLVAAMSNAGAAVKAYAKGGIIDYTGLAAVHGSPGNPEMVLSAADTAKFLEAAALMRNAPSIADIGTAGFIQSGFGGTVINGLNISIPIEHVQDYNDMIAQMQRDPKFDRLINAITLDRAAGKSNLSKYGVRLA